MNKPAVDTEWFDPFLKRQNPTPSCTHAGLIRGWCPIDYPHARDTGEPL